MTARDKHEVTVKIEGDGHSVEVTAKVFSPTEAANLAQRLWDDTKSPPRAGIGYAAQAERSNQNGNVAGDPLYNYGGPVTA